MTQFDTDNLSAPHTQRELGAEPAPAVDVSTEAVMQLMDRLDYMSGMSRDHAAGPLAIGHKALVLQAITTITALLARAEAAEAEVARLREVYWRLRSYATHDDGCKLNKAPRFSGPCSCGLADALKGGAA